MSELETTYRFCGTKEQLDAFLEELKGSPITAELNSQPKPYTPSFVEAQPLGEVGLLEVLINFTISLSANVAFDALREKIKVFRKKNPSTKIDQANHNG